MQQWNNYVRLDNKFINLFLFNCKGGVIFFLNVFFNVCIVNKFIFLEVFFLNLNQYYESLIEKKFYNIYLK